MSDLQRLTIGYIPKNCKSDYIAPGLLKYYPINYRRTGRVDAI